MKSAFELGNKKIKQKQSIPKDLINFVDALDWLLFCISELEEKYMLDEYGGFIYYMLGELSMNGINIEDLNRKTNKENYVSRYYGISNLIFWGNLQNIDLDHTYKIKQRGRFGKVLICESSQKHA